MERARSAMRVSFVRDNVGKIFVCTISQDCGTWTIMVFTGDLGPLILCLDDGIGHILEARLLADRPQVGSRPCLVTSCLAHLHHPVLSYEILSRVTLCPWGSRGHTFSGCGEKRRGGDTAGRKWCPQWWLGGGRWGIHDAGACGSGRNGCGDRQGGSEMERVAGDVEAVVGAWR